MVTLKAAVIGAGHIAQQHLAALRSLRGVQVVGVCDLSPALAEATAERHGVAAYFTDYRVMMGQTRPDVVHITTPAPTHFALTMDALTQGAHVLVEKPIATVPGELDQLCDLAERSGLRLVEDQNYLFNDTIRRLLGMIASGDFGQVVHMEAAITLDILGEGSRFTDPNAPHPSLAAPGGAISDFLTHLACMSWAFVGPHTGVRTLWSKRDPSTPLPSDEFRATVKADRGTASLMFSAHAQPDAFCVRVYGTKMRAEAHLFEPRLTVERAYEKARPLTAFRNGRAVARASRRDAYASLWRKLGGGPGAYHGLWNLVDRMYAGLRDQTPPPVTLDQIRQVNRLVADLTRSENVL